jgi:hypothetical protein
MSSEIKVDTISEKTSANGVVIDGVTLKDSKIGGTITIPGSTGTMALTSDITSGLAEADQWEMTSDSASSADPITNWARADTGLIDKMGTGMSESSGIWTFPSTGYYYVQFNGVAYAANGGSGGRITLEIRTSNDGFSSDDTLASQQRIFKDTNGQNVTAPLVQSCIVDITNTTNDKIKFKQNTTGTGTLQGTSSSTIILTNVIFLKLGDT